jgi:hypothetical protein
VICPGNEREPCRGRLLLETADAVSIRLGRASFRVAAGRGETVPVKLNRKARERLRRRSWLGVLATATVTDQNENVSEEEVRFALLAPRRKAARK